MVKADHIPAVPIWDLPLVCPCENRCELGVDASGGTITCTRSDCIHSHESSGFRIQQGRPIIISESRCDTVCVSGEAAVYVERPLSKFQKLKKLIVGESAQTKKNVDLFINGLMSLRDRPRVLVIGAGEEGSGMSSLWDNPNLEVHGVDIYVSPTVDMVCDAHYLPLYSEYYDGVVIQAVLEHVVEPTVVVGEIYRVLRAEGLVYAETPFMQQVHEGAYDFTRYTVLGHRYLFKNFEAIGFGGNKGAGVVLTWALRYFVWSLTRSQVLGKICGWLVGIILRMIDPFMSNKSLFDASSGVYFLGRKSVVQTLTHKDLVSLYDGQFK